MPIFDTHCHIDVEDFDADRAEVLRAARAAGVQDMLVPGVQRSTWPSLIALCEGDPHLHLALGMHPVYLQQHQDTDIPALVEAVERHQPIAIGEIGLDWYVDGLDRNKQQALLERQLQVAQDAGLPVVLHVRKAHDAMLNTLKRYRLTGGFSHAFNGSLEQARRYLDMGFCLGFGGMLTYERSSRLRRLATELPVEAIVLETDAPDMTVASHQYERNSPAYLPDVLKTLAELKQMSEDEVAAQTTANAKQILGLI
ncbi:TatD family hydrolase [Thiosocius teredinicola]|uniref:TatD family hydrolase n=1 Tax=Thiosocius teredinicola TaxID=1973002 RepID=UPI0009912B1B